MTHRSSAFERWLIEQQEHSQPSELEDLEAEAIASPGWDQIAWIMRHLVMAEMEMTPDLLRHAIQVGERRHLVGAPLDEIQEDRHPPLVYYMRRGDLVKIGTTKNLSKRLEAIRPQELLAVEPGGEGVETTRHADFAALRSHYEWFRYEEPLVTYVLLLWSRIPSSFGMPFEDWKRRRGLRI